MQARMTAGLVTVLAIVVVASAVTLALMAPGAIDGPGRAPGGVEERLDSNSPRTSGSTHSARRGPKARSASANVSS